MGAMSSITHSRELLPLSLCASRHSHQAQSAHPSQDCLRQKVAELRVLADLLPLRVVAETEPSWPTSAATKELSQGTSTQIPEEGKLCGRASSERAQRSPASGGGARGRPRHKPRPGARVVPAAASEHRGAMVAGGDPAAREPPPKPQIRNSIIAFEPKLPYAALQGSRKPAASKQTYTGPSHASPPPEPRHALRETGPNT